MDRVTCRSFPARGPGKVVHDVQGANSRAKRMLAEQWEVQGTPLLRLRILICDLRRLTLGQCIR